jgi:hypothetical protein
VTIAPSLRRADRKRSVAARQEIIERATARMITRIEKDR